MKFYQEEVEEQQSTIFYVDSRFGKIRIDTSKSLYFANGLLGIEQFNNYCLANFPNKTFERFKILQSLDDAGLAFIVLPYIEHNDQYSNLYEKDDLDKLANELELEREKMGIILITSINRDIETSKAKISVNLRAPIVINFKNNCAIQYVFTSNKYNITEQINLPKDKNES